MKKTDLKRTFSSMKRNLAKKTASMKKKKSAPFHGYAKNEGEAMPRRKGKFVIPIGVQTVIAVLVCCGVLLLVGAGIFTSQQMEIADLKAEIKSYVDDGVVPASSMTESLLLNIETLAARVDIVQREIDSAQDGKLSNQELQWLGVQISEIQIEAERLNEVLTAAEADKALRKSFNETVQSPLVAVAETYSSMTVNDADIVDTNVENGASNDTGAFKVAGSLEKNIRWIVLAAIVIVLVVVGVLFRHKIMGLFRRGGKKQAKGRTAKAEVKAEAAQPKKEAPKAQAKGKEVHVHPFAEEQTAKTEGPQDGEDLLAVMAKLGKDELEKAEEAVTIPEPSEAERITFDATVVTQEDIDEDDDPLFRKVEE